MRYESHEKSLNFKGNQSESIDSPPGSLSVCRWGNHLLSFWALNEKTWHFQSLHAVGRRLSVASHRGEGNSVRPLSSPVVDWMRKWSPRNIGWLSSRRIAGPWVRSWSQSAGVQHRAMPFLPLHGAHVSSFLLHVPALRKPKECKNFAHLDTSFSNWVLFYLTTEEMSINGGVNESASGCEI